MPKLAAEFIRVSTGSQDETSQIRDNDEYADANDITVVKRFILHGYSASKGMQEPKLREVIADMERGDYTALIMTDSARLDRRDDLDAQAEILLAIRRAGGEVISITEPQFGKTDFVGRIVTLVAQQGNAEKSRKVKDSTFRGIRSVAENKGHYGALPMFWATEGARYAKQAYCTDPESVADIYERIAGGESLESVARVYDVYSLRIKKLVRFTANHTGVIECSYTHDIHGTAEWSHTVRPVVSSPLWWRANKVLDANATEARANKGGRPVAQPTNWISGILDCPACGGKVYLNPGLTPARDHRTGKPRIQRIRTPKLRCGGRAHRRISCGGFLPADAQPIIDLISATFAGDTTEILAFQRVSGNAHELDALNAELRRIQARLSATENDDELDALVAERKAVKARINGFVIEPDSFDYAPTGRTVAQMWNDGDDTVKRGMVRAVKDSWGITLVNHKGRWRIAIGRKGAKDTEDTSGIVDLGNGLCFRR